MLSKFSLDNSSFSAPPPLLIIIAQSLRSSCVFIKTDVKIGIFPIPIAYWLGFGIFKQNRKNPDKIGMFGHSELVTEIQMNKNHTRAEGHASVFLFNVQVLVRSFATITIYMLF